MSIHHSCQLSDYGLLRGAFDILCNPKMPFPADVRQYPDAIAQALSQIEVCRRGLRCRALSLLIVRAAGYRPRTVGGHYNTFLARETADPACADLSAYFDGCPMKRNSWEFDFVGGVSDTDAEGLLKTVHQFELDAEARIKARYPSLPDYSGKD